jgi:glc operon protein GlcG
MTNPDTRAPWAPRRMSLALANLAAEAAQRHAAARNETISVAIVDDAGHLVLFQRGDGCSFISCETARGKAALANGFRLPTAGLAAQGPERAAFWSSVTEKLDMVVAGGGQPIVRDGLLIGAIGCGGGHGDLDEACAIAGAAALSDPT